MAINDVDRSACIQLVHYREMGTRQDTDAKCRRLVNQICIYAHEKGYRQSDEAPANKNDPVFKEACKPLVRRKADKGHFGALPPEDMPEFMAQLKRMPGVGGACFGIHDSYSGPSRFHLPRNPRQAGSRASMGASGFRSRHLASTVREQ